MMREDLGNLGFKDEKEIEEAQEKFERAAAAALRKEKQGYVAGIRAFVASQCKC